MVGESESKRRALCIMYPVGSLQQGTQVPLVRVLDCAEQNGGGDWPDPSVPAQLGRSSG